MSPSAQRLAGAVVVHLSFSPPFAPGSYNSLVQALVARPGPPRQVAVSYWDGPLPPGGDPQGTVLVGPADTPRASAAVLRLPERVRRLAFDGMGSRDRIRYALEVAALLGEARPPVVVVWDDYKLGAFLRQQVADDVALVLSQHGRSYHLPPAAARDVYRLTAFDAVVTLTRSSYRADRDQVYAYEPLVLVCPNGVDPVRFSPPDEATSAEARRRWRLPDTVPVVLALARLAPSKGAHLLVHSWPRVLEEAPDALLWLVGGGDPAYRERLGRQVQRLGLRDHVRFEGPVDRDEVPGCLAAADLYAFPSVQDEGHPLSLLEAMASGLACVAADSPVVRELHEGGVELVADPGVEDAFVAPVVALLDDDDRRAALGRAARRQVERDFTLDRYLTDLTGFLTRLAASRAGR